MARSSIPLFNADRLAGKDPDEKEYIPCKKYTLEDAHNFTRRLEESDREANLFDTDRYVIFGIDYDGFLGVTL